MSSSRTPSAESVRERVGAVVAQVVGAAVREAGASGVVLLDDGSPEAALALDWCRSAVGEGAVHAVAAPEAGAAASLARAAGVGDVDAAVAAAEAHRFRARLEAARRGALVASPANKTALLLGPVPPEPLLPLGDLYAGQVQALTGGWSAPEPVRELARRAGGVERLDAVLARIVDDRYDPGAALAELPAGVAPAVRDRLEAGRSARRRVGLVPKLGARTLGIDLFA